VQFDSKVVGGAGGKPDVVMTFDVNINKVLDVINKTYANRTETVRANK
jgi:hypothetical protein